MYSKASESSVLCLGPYELVFGSRQGPLSGSEPEPLLAEALPASFVCLPVACAGCALACREDRGPITACGVEYDSREPAAEAGRFICVVVHSQWHDHSWDCVRVASS